MPSENIFSEREATYRQKVKDGHSDCVPARIPAPVPNQSELRVMELWTFSQQRL